MSKTRKVWVDSNERYPVYSVSGDDDGKQELDLPVELLERFQRAEAEWDAVQAEVGELYEAAFEEARAQRDRAEAERKAAERAERAALEAERRRRLEEEQVAKDAVWARVEAAGGVVFDAAGNQIGTLVKWQGEARLQP